MTPKQGMANRETANQEIGGPGVFGIVGYMTPTQGMGKREIADQEIGGPRGG